MMVALLGVLAGVFLSQFGREVWPLRHAMVLVILLTMVYFVFRIEDGWVCSIIFGCWLIFELNVDRFVSWYNRMMFGEDNV